MHVVSIDCETHLISPETALPPVVCMVAAMRDSEGRIGRMIVAGDDCLKLFGELLRNPDVLIVNQSLAFDLGVLCASFAEQDPELITDIFDALEANRMTDIAVREKLIALATHGDLKFMAMPDGTNVKAEYNLAFLAKKYLGKVREKGKEADDTWRTNFHLLDGVDPSDYPDDAIEYLNDDGSDPLEIWEIQEEQATELGCIDSLRKCEFFRTRLGFCLKLVTAWGFDTDEEFKAALQKRVDEEYTSPDTMKLMVAAGLMTPAQEPRPYANGCSDKVTGEPKMTAGKKAKKNSKPFQEYVKLLCETHGITVKYTDPSDRHPNGQVSTDAEVMEELSGLDAVIDEYIVRNKLNKLATTELPRMSGGRIVRPNFDVLKKTGRISSFAGKHSPYPAFNAQNVDPRARGAFVARDGCVIVSADYSANELVSAAQVYLRVVGYSVLADVINRGDDPHAYLGAQIALYLSDTFRASCEAKGCKNAQEVYQLFVHLKHAACGGCADCTAVKEHQYRPDNNEGCSKAFYKYYRTFAKPTGLGYPGGLGPKTFIKYAKGTFKVTVTEKTARTLREIWRTAYPEVVEFFKWLNVSAVDPCQPDMYCYTSPMGMMRAGCRYTEAANGMALQTPSAEWMMLALCRIVREQYDPSLGSCLLGTHTLAPIHDEILAEIPEDEYMTERAQRIATLMEEAGKEVAPDLTHRVEPCLMYRWNKSAESVRDEHGKLQVWEPRAC